MLDREPLLTRATITSAVVAVVAILGTLGVHVAPQLQDAVVQLITLAAILGPIVAAWLSRGHVTPVAAPKSADGTPLVPQVVQAVQALAADVQEREATTPTSAVTTTTDDVVKAAQAIQAALDATTAANATATPQP